MNKKILVLALASVMIASCSKKTDESAAVADSAENTAVAVEAEPNGVEAEAADHQPNTSPVTEQKPDVILSAPNPAEANRRMVREANVNFTAKDVVKTALEIEKITMQAGGFIEQKNIDFNVVDKNAQSIAEGKIKIFEKVDPLASMIIRIPSEKAASVVNQLLPLMYFLNQQQYSAKRYELRLLQDKISQTQYVPSDTKNKQLNEIDRLTQLEVNDRVRYSTISITISQPTLVRERIDVDIDAVARLNGDSFWKRAWNGIQYGWQFVLDLMVILITIWPLYLLVFIAIIIYRIVKPYIDKMK
ncbi:DUF4349 domain-containing protein [Acinetobacter shaoyimingii]|uniref:DUF4349 domain-containing protein n=1 Tax=Acinetobacter shaoyimingii TaxID=2715164 RepID=A0A6G8RWA2_9GAMM|nr:DUF4349 domain-containing protein [Acinetobacter shaoyimingii]QIO06078.1 DUF4349 domain-containing protein [Acinetobacter shaoyimingii]